MVQMQRNITDVCIAIIEKIPDDETNSDAVKLRNDIQYYINHTLVFKAPELLSDGKYFIEVAIILNQNIPIIKENWHEEIKKCFNNE